MSKEYNPTKLYHLEFKKKASKVDQQYPMGLQEDENQTGERPFLSLVKHFYQNKNCY